MIKNQIQEKKKYQKPYFATTETINTIIGETTGNFPYNDFFKGQYDKTSPTFFERKGGYVPPNTCYTDNKQNVKQSDQKLHVLFQTATNIVYPTYPEFLDKYNDKQKIEIGLNHKCVAKQI